MSFFLSALPSALLPHGPGTAGPGITCMGHTVSKGPLAIPPLPPLQRGPGDGCWSSHCPILRRVQPEMYSRGCSYIKGWSPGQSAAWAHHCGTTGQGEVVVHSLVGKIPWSFPATLQCPQASGQASSMAWDQTCFGLTSSSPPGCSLLLHQLC